MRLRTIRQAVEEHPGLGSEAAFRQAILRGKYPSYKVGDTCNSRRLVDLDEIEQHVRQHRIPANDEAG